MYPINEIAAEAVQIGNQQRSEHALYALLASKSKQIKNHVYRETTWEGRHGYYTLSDQDLRKLLVSLAARCLCWIDQIDRQAVQSDAE